MPSALAQADALVAKGARFPVLCEAVREAAAGVTTPPEISGTEHQALNELLDPADVAIAGLLLLRTSSAEIARMTGVSGEELSERVEAILHRVMERRDALAAGTAASLA